ncbi:polysaccharide lyase [Antrihabitans cavernicola]|uniref:Polysaccharide lyase-like protein n=1 Tax=Antrihabitans cavernicola TaxID=2495913 RepID=A0A5A7SGK9_9NOCA|nr:polysaccharide lyase [Spelaeibacter cavernicola]KAA0023837.1 hypothetical protein FOY51_04375 [Spelaeibacter cavernicola]
MRLGSVSAALLLLLVAVCSQAGAPLASAGNGFIGDFETGNLNQWQNCQDVQVVSLPCNLVGPSQSISVESDVVRQGRFAARFQVRGGDQPAGLCCGDRAEVSGEGATAANEGDDRWYQWSTRFDTGFPATQGWSVVSQWHAIQDGSPPVAIDSGPVNISPNHWGITVSTWNAPGIAGPTFTPWSAPIDRGAWNDIKMHIHWSANDSFGFIEFWLDGARQTFTAAPCAGQTRCMVRTLMPGGGGVYFKQGYYRDPAITAPGVVYHDGLSIADTEAGLAPL